MAAALAYQEFDSGWAHTGNFLTATHTFGGTHATHSMRVNGDAVALTSAITGDPGAAAITDSLFIGARSGGSVALNGDIAELFVYGSALNTAETNIINNYLSARYATPLSVAIDRYAGDENGNGDYDFDVVGIGQESDGALTSTPAGAGGGLQIAAGSGFGNTEYLLAGNDGTPHGLTPTEGFSGERWERIFYLDMTGEFEATLTFDFDEAGLPSTTGNVFSLLYSADDSPLSWVKVGAGELSGNQVQFLIDTAQLSDGYYTLAIAQVPEPSSFLLLGFGAIGLARQARRRRLART